MEHTLYGNVLNNVKNDSITISVKQSILKSLI